jgi:hypothetical protein
MSISISRPMSADRSSAWPVGQGGEAADDDDRQREEDHQEHQQQVDQADGHQHGIGHGDDAVGQPRADAGLVNRRKKHSTRIGR